MLNEKSKLTVNFENESERVDVGSVKKSKSSKKGIKNEDIKKYTTQQQISYLAKKTHYDTEQIKTLLELYKKLTKPGPMNRLRFREAMHIIFDIKNDNMLDRLYYVCNEGSGTYVNEIQWVQLISTIIRGTIEEQIKLCYKIYDINGDGSIGKDELQIFLQGCIYRTRGNENDEELISSDNDIVALVIKKFDQENLGYISFERFREVCLEDPTLLQCIGSCLPSAKAMATFQTIFEWNYRNYSSGLSPLDDIAWTREVEKHNLAEKLGLYVQHKRKSSLIGSGSLKKFGVLGQPLHHHYSHHNVLHTTHSHHHNKHSIATLLSMEQQLKSRKSILNIDLSEYHNNHHNNHRKNSDSRIHRLISTSEIKFSRIGSNDNELADDTQFIRVVDSENFINGEIAKGTFSTSEIFTEERSKHLGKKKSHIFEVVDSIIQSKGSRISENHSKIHNKHPPHHEKTNLVHHSTSSHISHPHPHSESHNRPLGHSHSHLTPGHGHHSAHSSILHSRHSPTHLHHSHLHSHSSGPATPSHSHPNYPEDFKFENKSKGSGSQLRHKKHTK